MASSGDDDDDNGYLLSSDDPNPIPNPNRHHHHDHLTPHQHLPHHPQPPAFLPRFPSKSSPVLPSAAAAASGAAESPFHDVGAPFAADDGFVSPTDPARSRSDKRRSNEELSDGDTATTPPAAAYAYKKSKSAASANSEYRKDREEWSDTAIACLLEAYTEKYVALNRGNLRVRDWEEVAAVVSERCEKPTKSVEQCKNKVDNLKKRFKLERHRMSNGGVSASHWPWYKKLEEIVGNMLAAKSAAEDDKGRGGGGGGGGGGDSGVGSAAPSQQSKR